MKNNSAKIIAKLQATYKKKNHDYGNSFDQSLNEDGLIAAKVRIGDKVRRINNLITGVGKMVNDESLNDTLLDLANYSIMTMRWMDKKTIEEEYKILSDFIDNIIISKFEDEVKYGFSSFITVYLEYLYKRLGETMKLELNDLIHDDLFHFAVLGIVFPDYLNQVK